MTPPRLCHQTTDDTWVLIGQHRATCPHPDLCIGCRPCTHDPDTGQPWAHCTSCTRHTDPARPVCAVCIGNARQLLGRVVVVAGNAYREALIAGVDSDAASLAGPAADYETWLDHQVAAHHHGQPWETGDLEHPTVLIRYWLTIATDEHDLQPGAGGEWQQLADLLDPLARTADWPNLLADLRAATARAQARSLLTETGRPRPRRGAPCPLCGRALVLHHHVETDPDTNEPRLDDDGLQTPADTWECDGGPRGHAGLDHAPQVWTLEEYAVNVAWEAAHHADRLCATDMLDVYRIKPGTLTSWATKGLVRRRGRDTSGRQLYDVADALAQRDRGAQHAAGE